jgi:hypothetical protein
LTPPAKLPDLSAGLCLSDRAGLEPGAWTSDDGALRELAIRTCGLCPVLRRCASWAETLPQAWRYDAVLGGHWYGHSGRRADAQAEQRAQAELAKARRRAQAELREVLIRQRAQAERRALAEREQLGPSPYERAAAALRRDPDRSNVVIAVEAGAAHTTVCKARHRLEAAGEIPRVRRVNGHARAFAAPLAVTSDVGPTRAQVITAALLGNAERSNAVIAVQVLAGKSTVGRVRRELEAEGVIPGYRGTPGPRGRQTAAPGRGVSADAAAIGETAAG